jgi:hypothetical protein
MNFHMYCGLTFIADKLVGMHLPSVSKFGGKVKAQNGTIKPSNALNGHYRLVSPTYETSTGNLYFVLFLGAAETFLPPTLITGLDFIGLRLPLILGLFLCIPKPLCKVVTNRLGSDIFLLL